MSSNPPWLCEADITSDALCRRFMTAVTEGGSDRCFEGHEIREVWGLTGMLTDPRARLFSSKLEPTLFNAGLACARWLYLLSGSDRLQDIAHYSHGARRFSDDGVTMPGGSHGARIFYCQPGINQFDAAVATLRELGETTRVILVLQQPTDLMHRTADYICVANCMLTIRDGRLHTLVQMRSGEVLRLMPYDLFEFTMLAEYVAMTLDLQLGSYIHSGFVFQITGKRDQQRAVTLAAETVGTTPMATMPAVHPDLRARVIAAERRLREAASYAGPAQYLELLRQLADLDPYWRDVITAAAIQGRLMRSPAAERTAVLEAVDAAGDAGPLAWLTLEYSRALV